MPATARSNDFSIFIRKIGFSVGLEYTLDRLRDFATLYSSKDVLTYADMHRLLHSARPRGWQLDANNEHVLDVMRSLEVFSVQKGEVTVLEVGEALGILRKMQDDKEFERSLRFIFAHELIRADGDVFLNALAACFDASDFSMRMHRMLEFKWNLLERAFPSSYQRAAIYLAVNIETQDNNPGSRGHGLKGRGPLEVQTTLAGRLGPLRPLAHRPTPQISRSYLTKALPRRKAWAVSLGLADEAGNQTQCGGDFLQSLAESGLGGPGCLAVWPLTYELNAPVFVRADLPSQTRSTSWEFLLLIGRAIGITSDLGVYTDREHADAIDLLSRFLHVFRSLNQSKRIMRVELPGRVAYRCALAWNIGRDSVPPYEEVLLREQNSERPRLVIRPSRLAEFAISD